MQVRAHFCQIDGSVLRRMEFVVQFEVSVTVRAYFHEIDGWMLWGCYLGAIGV